MLVAPALLFSHAGSLMLSVESAVPLTATVAAGSPAEASSARKSEWFAVSRPSGSCRLQLDLDCCRVSGRERESLARAPGGPHDGQVVRRATLMASLAWRVSGPYSEPKTSK
jgi:hypothetical protein